MSVFKPCLEISHVFDPFTISCRVDLCYLGEGDRTITILLVEVCQFSFIALNCIPIFVPLILNHVHSECDISSAVILTTILKSL